MKILSRLLLTGLLWLPGCDPPPEKPPSSHPGRSPSATAPARITLAGVTPSTLTGAGQSRPIHSLINVTKPMRYGDSVWNEAGVPPGSIWIRIDLRSQILSVFRGGNEIGTSIILYGADQKPTPRGQFPILAMLKDHRSSLYDAVMPYTLRLTGDGVSIHGSNVREHAATHGCIGVPTDFARHLFAAAHVGDVVTIE